MLTGITFKMYHTQIKKETAALEEYDKQTAELRAKQRQEQVAQFMESQQIQAATAAANDEASAQAELESEEAYTSEEEKRRAQTEAADEENYIPEKKYGT